MFVNVYALQARHHVMQVFGKLGVIILTIVCFMAVWIRQTPPYPDLGGTGDLKLYPVDQANLSPEFFEFRAALIKALERRDLNYVLDHVDDTIRYSFGPNEGVKGFLEYWDLGAAPEQSQFWDELLQVLRLGGKFIDPDQDMFMAPYVYTSFPEQLDPFQHAVVVGRDVKVYAEPVFSAQVLGTLTYSIVQLIPHQDMYEISEEETVWRKIMARSGSIGYVPDQFVRSPVDYRAGFSKTNGEWKLVFFVAGD